MDISVTDFKAHCLNLIRKVESSGKAITIRRRGQVVARLEPAGVTDSSKKAWEQLRSLGGMAHMKANESVMTKEDFEAQR
jgi:antitoxin (DNA-binding transcriptional repressor) of toxin-antitoxin stability system